MRLVSQMKTKAKTTRHNKPSDDSDYINVVVPKKLKEHCKLLASSEGCSFSDMVRRCLFIGADTIERRTQNAS